MPVQDAIALIKEDHRRVKQLFREADKLGDRANRSLEARFARIMVELNEHATAEETVLYPALRERSKRVDDDVLEGLEEHHVVKLLLAELEKMKAADERFRPKLTVLKEMVLHHAQEEEETILPAARKAFSKTELVDMADAMRAAKKTAPSRPHPAAPDTPPANLAASMVSAPMDRARDAVGSAVGVTGRVLSRTAAGRK